MQANFSVLTRPFPKKFVRLKVNLSTSMRIRNPFCDDLHQRPVVKIGTDVALRARTFHSSMKRNRNLYTRLSPACILVQPLPFHIAICITVAKLSIYFIPFSMADMIWLKGGIADDVNEFLEGLLRFLDTATPIPVTQKKRTLVRERVEAQGRLR